MKDPFIPMRPGVVTLSPGLSLTPADLFLVLIAVIVFNVASLVAGYLMAQWARLDRRQCIEIGMEVGAHSGALAIGLALSPLVLNSPTMAVPPAPFPARRTATARAAPQD